MKIERERRKRISKWGGSVIGALAIVMSGCWSVDTIDSAEVDESTVYGDYSVQYDGSSQRLKFFAQLRVGGSTGTTVRLTPPSELLADGETMRRHDGDEEFFNFSGTYYTYERREKEPKDHYFITWKTNSGEVFQNRVVIPEAASIVSIQDGAKVSRQETLPVKVHVKGSRKGQRVEVVLRSKAKLNGNDQVSTLSAKVEGSGYAYFSAKDLVRLPKGSASLRVERTHGSTSVNGHKLEGGYKTETYLSPGVDVTLE